MTWGDVVTAVAAGVQAAVIVLGVLWGYYKFVKGRTFANRAELTVAGDLLEGDGRRAIKVRVALKNTGTSDVRLRSKTLHLNTVVAEGWKRQLEWKPRVAKKVFKNHKWIEAQETIYDERLIPLVEAEDDGAVIAYWIECRVYEGKEGETKDEESTSLRWTANTIVPATLQPPPSEPSREEVTLGAGAGT